MSQSSAWRLLSSSMITKKRTEGVTMCVFVCLCDVRVGKVAPSSGQCCLSVSAGPSIGSLFHMADDLGRAMESLVSVMTDEQSAEQHEALPF